MYIRKRKLNFGEFLYKLLPKTNVKNASILVR